MPKELETPQLALAWIRGALEEMCEFPVAPEFVTYSYRLDRKTIEFLSERIITEKVRMRRPYLNLRHGDTVRELIFQMQTDGSF